MIDDYLKTFDNLFFNVENDKNVKSTIEQVNSLLASIITKYGEIENEMSFGTSRQDDFIDMVICLFIRKIMEQLDAINVLYSICSFCQAQIILRSLVENIISLEFILKENTKERAAAYFLDHHYQEIELGTIFFDENSKNKDLAIESIGTEKFQNDFERFKKKKEAFTRLINSKDIFKKMDIARTKKLNIKKEKTKKQVYIKWYEVCSNISSFYGMMKETGYEKYYQGIYGTLSYETHALNSTMDMKVNKDGINLQWIRNPEGGSSTFSLTCSFSISALIKIYEYLKDGKEERNEFRKFYIEFKKKEDIVCSNLDRIKSNSNQEERL